MPLGHFLFSYSQGRARGNLNVTTHTLIPWGTEAFSQAGAAEGLRLLRGFLRTHWEGQASPWGDKPGVKGVSPTETLLLAAMGQSQLFCSPTARGIQVRCLSWAFTW